MIFVECNADRALVTALGWSRKRLQHAGDKGAVCNRLKKSPGSMGLIDEDPMSPQPTFVAESVELERAHGVIVREHRQSKTRLVVVSPRLEDWVFDAVRAAGETVESYGYPPDKGLFHSAVAVNQSGLVRIVEALGNKSDRLLALRKYLSDQKI